MAAGRWRQHYDAVLSHHWELADLRGGKMQPLRPALSALQFESLDKTYHLTELARGDFNGDGFEDTLVAVSWHYREGTGLGCSILLVQRVQNEHLTIKSFLLRGSRSKPHSAVLATN